MADSGETLLPIQTHSVLAGGDFLHLENILYANYSTSDFEIGRASCRERVF